VRSITCPSAAARGELHLVRRWAGQAAAWGRHAGDAAFACVPAKQVTSAGSSEGCCGLGTVADALRHRKGGQHAAIYIYSAASTHY
jgi:hypothetical protein